MNTQIRYIKLMSIAIIVYALWDWRVFANFSFYSFLFKELPKQVILMRYIGSICLRIAFIVSAIGTFCLKDIFRKLVLGLSFFTLATMYWKHPIDAFRNVVTTLITTLVERGAVPLNGIPFIGYIPWIVLVINYVIDIVFMLCVIVVFLRPGIKQQFK